ncbi:hypothetical protein VPH35_042236 [Triticum aestivum]
MVRGTDHGVVAIDTSSLAAPTLTTCLTDCPNRDATVNNFKTTGSFSPSRGMFSTVAAPAEALPALELEALKPNRCLTECSHDEANKVTHVVLNHILCNTSPCAMPWVCEDTDDEQIGKGGVMQPLWPPWAPPSTWQLRFVEHTIANSTELKPWPYPWMSKSSGSGSRDKPPWVQNAVSLGKSDKLRELYEKSESSWRLTKSETPGNIGSFEDIRCANNVMQYSPFTILSPRPCYKERCSFLQISQLYVGLSCVNMSNQKLGLTEFPKIVDSQMWNQPLLHYIARSKAEFKSRDLVQDLGRIIKGSVEPVRDLLSQFDYALGALGSLKYNLDCYLRLVSAMVRTLNIVEGKTDGNNQCSLFALMNRVCTSRMGQGLLNKWLYVNEVNNRLDMVQAFTEDPELRRGLRQQLTWISDLDRLTHALRKKSANQPIVKLYQSCSRISYIKGDLQQYNGQFSRFRTRFLSSFEEWMTENWYVPYVRPDITTSEGGDILLQGSWHPYKVQSAENYMKFSMGNITRAFLELHISPSGQPNYDRHVPSAPGMFMRSQFGVAVLEFSPDGSVCHLPLQSPLFVQTNIIEIYSPWIQCSPFLWWFQSATRASHEWTPCITMFSCICKHVRMFIAGLSYEMNHQPQAKERVQHNIGFVLESSRRLLSINCPGDLYTGEPKGCTCQFVVSYTSCFRGILCMDKNEMSHPSVVAPFGNELLFCSFELTICKHVILSYDPGGPALLLDGVGGIHEFRLIIIGLRASRISRKGECNTPTMGCHPTVATWAWATRWANHWRLKHGWGERIETSESSRPPATYLIPLLLILTPNSPCIS